MTHRVCIVTGSRAEYGLLYGLMREIELDEDLELQIIATGMHLSPEFGLTYKNIESDGFSISAKVEILLSSDSPVGVSKSIGLGVISFAECFERLSPNIIIVLGDRFEIFAAAQAAMILQIPLAHLAGGDNGLGTYDNIIRHCITKMASLHFVTNEDASRRVIQLGESPERVFCYGATNVDRINQISLLSKSELERDLSISLKKNVFLVTFHPLTMDKESAEDQLLNLLSVLDDFLKKEDYSIIFTKSNADNGGRSLNEIIVDYVARNDNCYMFDSLGQVRYLSIMKIASLVLGNSSSGIYEAPYMQIATVDIGNRQRGRLAPASVVNCDTDKSSIKKAIELAMGINFNNVPMLYGNGNVSKKIINKLKEYIDTPDLVVKSFYHLGK